MRPCGQAVKTPPFHGGIPGSNPGRVTKTSLSGFERTRADLWIANANLRDAKLNLALNFRVWHEITAERSSRTNKFTLLHCEYGSIAQLGEHLPYKQGVIGSSPIVSTTSGLVVQLVRMPACHAGGRRFEPDPGRQLKF